MFGFVRTAALTTLIGLGAIGATAGTAQADSIRFGFGPGGAHVGVHIGHGHDGWRRHHRRHDFGRHHGRHDFGRHHRRHDFGRRDFRRAFCTQSRALHKAERLGVRRAHVVRANEHIIKVRGRRWGHRVNVVFARAPYCPIIG